MGTKRVLDLFGEYFSAVESLDGRAWAYLFSGDLEGPPWPRIVFVGKDRSGLVRRSLDRIAGEVLFIELYPDHPVAHVEDYQAGQLSARGIRPCRKETPPRTGRRVILYPEKPFRKKKWPVERFAEVHGLLKERGMDVVLLAPPVSSFRLECPFFERLGEIAAFLSAGGFFVSNDSGMAHFAARCGLVPLTLFSDTDPRIWRPKGGLVIHCGEEWPEAGEVAEFVVKSVDGLLSCHAVS